MPRPAVPNARRPPRAASPSGRHHFLGKFAFENNCRVEDSSVSGTLRCTCRPHARPHTRPQIATAPSSRPPPAAATSPPPTPRARARPAAPARLRAERGHGHVHVPLRRPGVRGGARSTTQRRAKGSASRTVAARRVGPAVIPGGAGRPQRHISAGEARPARRPRRPRTAHSTSAQTRGWHHTGCSCRCCTPSSHFWAPRPGCTSCKWRRRCRPR